ncbi:MAG: helix-turn-helix transcriptional regulator [Acholeplasmatales bacterium]|jgi:transcriptional regulator with XRE-family HTH domain|nr:helix-turn-helix transcriptional regulator [Acholeplasmatales bacterium]
MEKKFDEILGFRLKELRLNLGVSLEHVAKAIGCSRQNYYFYETGDTGISSFMLKKIATFYNVNIDFLLSNELILQFPITRFDKYVIDDSGIVKLVDKIKISNPYNSMYIIECEKDYLVMQNITTYVDNSIMVIEYNGDSILTKVTRPTNLKDHHILIEVKNTQISVPLRSIRFSSFLVAKIVKIEKDHYSFLV